MKFEKLIPSKELIESKEFRSTAWLYGTQILFIGIGFINKSIQTKTLGPEIYGDFAFFVSFLMFSSLFFHFGFFSSAQVLIAEDQNKKKESELIGAALVYFLFCCVAYIIFILAIADFLDDFYDLSLSEIFRKLSFLAPLFTFRFFVNSLATGTGKVLAISIYPLISRVIFLIALGALMFYNLIDLERVLVWNLVSTLIAAVAILFVFKPSFKNFPLRARQILKKNKEHGFHMYTGAIFQQSTYKLDEMMIPYFVGTTGLGFYTLAGLLCSPIPLLSQSASRALYRKMAAGDRITPTFFRLNLIWLVSSGLGLALVVHWIVPILFGPGYEEVANIASVLVIAYVISGLLGPFMFLNAKSQGKRIRNANFIGTLVNVGGNFALIPIWGIMGAIYASILSRLFNFIFYYYYYKAYLRESQEK